MTTKTPKYRGPMIELDMERMAFKRSSDRQWMRLQKPTHIVLTQRQMQQTRGGGLLGNYMTNSYKAFCVYIKAGNLNILAYQGNRDKVEAEARRLSQFLDLKVIDRFPRDSNGKIIDDDAGESSTNVMFIIVIALVILLFLSAIFSMF